jgi:uncharacterized protein
MIHIPRIGLAGSLFVVGTIAAALSCAAQESNQKPLPPGYTQPGPVNATGVQPKMKVEELSTTSSKTYRVDFGTGDEIVAGLTEFAAKNHIISAHITGIGGLISGTLGWGDPVAGGMKKIDIGKKCELVSLIGNISSRGGHPYVHLHGVVSFSDGSTKGGHVIEARVNPLAEIFVVTTGGPSSAASSASPSQ